MAYQTTTLCVRRLVLKVGDGYIKAMSFIFVPAIQIRREAVTYWCSLQPLFAWVVVSRGPDNRCQGDY